MGNLCTSLDSTPKAPLHRSVKVRRGPLSKVSGIACGCCCLLGCAAVGPNFVRPAATSLPGYTMVGDKQTPIAMLTPTVRVAGPWWRSMGSAQLDTVMLQALAGNRTLAAAEATLARAQAQAAGARGAELPAVDLQANAQRERINFKQFGFAGFQNPTINLFSVGGTVSYDLDVFGGIRRRAESAAAAADAEGRRADAAYLTLTGDVALRAVRIADLRAQIATVRAIIADDEHNLGVVQAALAAGGASSSSGASVRAQLAEDQALLPPLDQQLAQTRHALAVLVGRSPSDWTAPDFDLGGFDPPGEIPVALPSELVRRRPDILAAEADLHAATAEIGVATASLYPDIRLVAGLTPSALTPGTLFNYDSSAWTLGAGLTAPLFHGGALRANQHAAQAHARESLALYQQTVLEAFSQVADVMTALAHDDDHVAALTRAQSAAEDALRDYQSAFALGGEAYLPLILAQRQLNRARLSLTLARGERLADIVKLYAATAADWRASQGGGG
jgi:NodT family efflux transporter outer membrane factor (OMF) lipoprotein